MAQQEVVKLPKGWIEGTASDLVLNPKNDIVDGPFGSNLKASEYTDSGTPIVRIQNVKRFRFVDKNIHFVTDGKAEQLKRHSFKAGDVLITKLGEPLGLACIAPKRLEYGIIVADIVRARPYAEISNKFMTYLLNSKIVIEQISKHTKGSTRARINLGVVRNLEIPIPPLPEQKRIVEKLDSLMSQVDTIQQRLNNLPNIIKHFRQSVLAAAVSGKLTEQWRKGNDVTNVKSSMSDILSARSEIVNARNKVPEHHLKDEEYPIDNSWEWVSLDVLSSKIVDGVHHKPEYIEEGIPFMSVKDIKNGKISFDFCKYISEKTHKEIHPRCNPARGDLLITKSGTIGRTAIIDTDDVFDLFVSVALIKPASSDVNMKFIDIALRKWVNGIDVSSRVVGTAIKNLHLRDMRVLAIPFAPIEEQTEIVRLVEQHFALADTLEKHLKNAKQRVDNLTQSILAKAFKGELVPQDPNDEPAEQLLARIKAARAEAEQLEKAAKKVKSKSAKS
ncbi:type I restriction enzyme, S subunit [Paraglaciecola mesophila KMM 241]|uniref:Type I restriction enzyme, S subunit n=1 Tax=Paraglaciecola mesophila KMM 241 TaxID=1128912 RepID=K6YH28_9ALTE|nr:restriction endonuclease subunit S [Paraglaciecola mesophila]GAC23276.1 type I restriction enzyme, S subunit [Paraglaciecola mesophila KMM 241]